MLCVERDFTRRNENGPLIVKLQRVLVDLFYKELDDDSDPDFRL